MLSRVADAIYWMNRYLERAENYARFLDVNFNLNLDLPSNVSTQWQPVIATTGDLDLYKSLYGEVEKESAIFFLGFDQRNPNSIYNCLTYARENARSVRPDITTEVWEQINYLYYLVREETIKKRQSKRDPRGFFSEVKKGCQLLCGIFDETISQTDGWHFGKIGQLIERADKTSRILDVKYHMMLPEIKAVGSPLDLINWVALLKSVSAYDMYRKQLGRITPQGITKFLILDKIFPRSMYRCLIHAEQSLHAITGNFGGYSNTAERELGLLKSQLEYADVNEITSLGLHEYLDSFQGKLNNVSNAIFESFFSIENTMRQQ